ncbi:MAG: FkbM family methyltransferase [Hyphomicrobiaceae bacterium]
MNPTTQDISTLETKPEHPVKKLLRSVQMLVPQLADRRYAAQDGVLRLAGRPWRPEVMGLAHLGYESPLVLDIGANRGFFISALEMVRPDARVIAFEPFPRLVEQLRARKSPLHVEVEGVALGSAPDKLPLYVTVYRGFPIDGLSSFDREMAAGWLDADRIHWFDPAALRVDEVMVEVRRLDDYGLAPDIVKMYVQGAEPLVIGGSVETLRRHQPAVLAPAHAPPIDQALRALGYRRYAFRGDARNGRFEREGENGYFSWYMTDRTLDRVRAPVVDR